jgi:hypothetical protein
MRRVLTALVLAGAIAMFNPCATHAQRGGGHAGGFGGGHAGGFSGGGFAAHNFGGGFAAPSTGFAPHYFPAPHMSFSQGPTGFSSSPHPYGSSPATRSPFGQLSIPAVRRAPYPGAYPRAYPGAADSRGWTNQPNHGGYPDGHGGHPYRTPYHSGVTLYSPYYATGIGWYWPWWPYFGNWDSGDYYAPNTTAAPGQTSDRYYAPETERQDTGRPGYQSEIAAGPAPAMPEPVVTIIYKDGHSQQIHNYALTRTTLLMLDDASSGLTPQISLDEINLPATEQVNRAQGVNFSLPVKN